MHVGAYRWDARNADADPSVDFPDTRERSRPHGRPFVVAGRTWRALQRFRAPLSKMKPEDFAEPQVLYQIGVPPSRIDIMTSVTGLEFDAAWPNRILATFGDVVAPVLGLDDMRTAKRAAGRLKDLADLEELG